MWSDHLDGRQGSVVRQVCGRTAVGLQAGHLAVDAAVDAVGRHDVAVDRIALALRAGEAESTAFQHRR